jgi:hypothetical protein
MPHPSTLSLIAAWLLAMVVGLLSSGVVSEGFLLLLVAAFFRSRALALEALVLLGIGYVAMWLFICDCREALDLTWLRVEAEPAE